LIEWVPIAWAGGSVADHLLGSYLRSLLAILLAQFSRKGFPGGMDGVVRLAEKVQPIQVGLIPCTLRIRLSSWLSMSRHIFICPCGSV